MKEFEKVIDDASQQTDDRLAAVLKVVVAKRKTIAHQARVLIDNLSAKSEKVESK